MLMTEEKSSLTGPEISMMLSSDEKEEDYSVKKNDLVIVEKILRFIRGIDSRRHEFSYISKSS